MSFKLHFGSGWLDIFRTKGYASLVLVALICGLTALWFLRKRKLNLPPGPIGLPFVGYLPYLGKEPFKTLDNLSKKYGSVLSLYMGQKYVVFLGDYPAFKEVLNSQNALDRPPGIFDFQPDGYGLTSASGKEWLQMRKFVMRTMKDVGLSRNVWELLVEEEVSDFLELIRKKENSPMNITKPLLSSAANNITSLVFGKRLPPGPRRDMLNSAIVATAVIFASAGLWNFFPWLCNIFVKLKLGKYHKLYSEMAGLNTFIRNEAEIHRKTRDFSKETDFLSRFIEAVESEQGKTTDAIFTERNLIGNCQALFTAGSETASSSLIWLFLAIAAHRNVQQTVHQELDSIIGRQRKILWEDRFSLPYTYAVLMEIQRWKTLVPLNLTRIASQDFKLFDYDIPKGSLIIGNIWALHNDPRYWKEPEKFMPERFLINGGKEVNHKAESYVPFSLGKRKCPGETAAMMEIFLYFTAVMQQYEVRVPEGEKPNFDAILGITYIPVGQDLCFIPR